MSSKPYLELDGISLRLNNRLVFRNTHWQFARNQNWAMVGSNGSGKTLLARAIAGELPVAKGEIQYGFHTPAGRIPEDFVVLLSFEQQKALAGDAPPAVRWFSAEQDEAPRVRQFLSQDSVEEVNPFEIRIRPPGVAVRYARLRRQIVKLLEINSLLNSSLPALSNGEMRKILLARALLKRPRLLILDDVFAGLDTVYREHLREILDRLMSQTGVRILLIGTRPNELPHGITHILWVHNCRIAAQGHRRIMMRNPRIRELFGNAKSPGVRMAQSIFPKHHGDQKPQDLIQMKNVSVRYGKRIILSDINWTVRSGESWALVGPNGSGKSTLLGLISGDNPQAYANAVYLFGRRRGSGESVWELKKRIGLISSELHLHFPESPTCLETVISGYHESMGCHESPTSHQRKTVLRMLRYFGISKFSRDSFGSLSTGIQRMTLLARALIKAPDLLLLDEPCQGLDPVHRGMFLQILDSILRHSETTIIYVTHVADEIPKGIRKGLQLQNGRIFRSGAIPKNRSTILKAMPAC
jgi:molybdate transport system ATP-binding protein